MRSILTCGLTTIVLVASTTAGPVGPAVQPPAPLRLAIAGLVHGHVGGFLRGAQGRQDVQIVGVFDPDRTLLEGYAKQYKIPDSVLFTDLGAMLAKANPEVVGARMYEMLTTDLRDDIARVTAPTLFIGSGAFASAEQQGEILARAEKQLAKLPSHRVVLAPHARHFVMLDAPSLVLSEMDAFLRASGV